MTTRTDAPTRREQILKEAARLFAERGFHGVGVDEIGAAVGISGPGLYRHFPGKDAMLAELLVGISGQLLTGAKRRLAEAEGVTSPGVLLDSLIEGHIDFALRLRGVTGAGGGIDRRSGARRRGALRAGLGRGRGFVGVRGGAPWRDSLAYRVGRVGGRRVGERGTA
jgi:AcrR family transcriptional regulator